MIRRDDVKSWIIIDQISHAHLAGQLARVWGQRPDSKPSGRDLGLAMQLADDFQGPGAHRFKPVDVDIWLAVQDHDNGWAQWDRAPRINPTTGVPRSFMEMRMEDATAIWTRSIDGCASRPLPYTAFAISRHFCYLAEQVRDNRRTDVDDRDAVIRFLKEQAQLQSKLADVANSFRRRDEFERHREIGFHTLQFFDRVSLWLCCAERDEPERFQPPEGDAVTFIPKPPPRIVNSPHPEVYRLKISRPDVQEWDIALDPYPLQVEPIELKVEAKRIEARRYIDDADLRSALNTAPSVQLIWTIHAA